MHNLLVSDQIDQVGSPPGQSANYTTVPGYLTQVTDVNVDAQGDLACGDLDTDL
jgi:hypothetical protein